MVSLRHQRRTQRAGGNIAADDTVAPDDRDLIDETIDVWQKRTERALTREDGREIIENMTGFLRILQEWDRAERAGESVVKEKAAEIPRKGTARAKRPDACHAKNVVPDLAKS